MTWQDSCVVIGLYLVAVNLSTQVDRLKWPLPVRYLATGEQHRGDPDRLAELVEALDEWISNGGALPTAWERHQLPPRARARALYIHTACLVQTARVAASRAEPARHQHAIAQLTDARLAAGAFYDEEIGK